MVSINPMNKDRELRLLLDDSGATRADLARVALRQGRGRRRAGHRRRHRHHDVRARLPRRRTRRCWKGSQRMRDEGTHDLLELVASTRASGPTRSTFGPDDVAFLTYTSGTTGPPKGAMNTHGNVVFNSQAYRDWMRARRATTSCSGRGAAVPHHRAHRAHRAGAAHAAAAGARRTGSIRRRRLDLVQRWKATFTVGVDHGVHRADERPLGDAGRLATLTKVYSGGAPVAPSVAQA